MTTIAFDIDGTLLKENGTPRYQIINLLFDLHDLGYGIYIWSGGGISYAETMAAKFGWPGEVVAKGSFTPDIVFDDMDAELGKVNLKV